MANPRHRPAARPSRTLSRRSFLKLLGATAAGIPLAAACGPARPPAGQTEFIRDAAPARLRVVTDASAYSLALRDAAMREYAPAARVQLDWTLVPTSDVRDLAQADAAESLGAIDAFALDRAWLADFAPQVEDLREWRARPDLVLPGYDFGDLLPQAVTHAASDGPRLVGLPYDLPVFVLMYRRDLLDELGLTAPTTPATFLATAESAHAALHPVVHGATAQWRAGHYGLLCSAMSWLWACGGSLFGADGRAAVNDLAGLAALEHMAALRAVVPADAHAWDWHDQHASLALGDAVMGLNWSEFFARLDDPAQSDVAGLFEAAPPPASQTRPATSCAHGEAPGAAVQGGSCLSIPRTSRNKSAAWRLIQWLTSGDVHTRAVLAGGATPVRASAFADDRVLARARVGPGTTRHYPAVLRAIQTGMGSPPSHPAWAGWMAEWLSTELAAFLRDEQDAWTTADNMAFVLSESFGPARA